jgi:NADPH-dependent glutamate synthase beta subunit-like oxidoreductase
MPDLTPRGPAPRDLTPLPDLVQGAGLTGPVRARRPVYVDLLPLLRRVPGRGEHSGLARRRAGGEYERAWRLPADDNPFPAIHGRVCYHPCEDACNRAELDSPVSVHAVERFLGDWAIDHHLSCQITARSGETAVGGEPAGKRVLVIGAGPSGLSAAYHLARRGHEVEIRDAGAEPGGMMRYGIPAYRLPRGVLAAEIQRIEAMDVRIVRDHTVTDLNDERNTFDATFIAATCT